MIISHRHKFIFIKTRKTAGTSIELGLSRFCGDDDVLTPMRSESAELKEDAGHPGARNYKVKLSDMTMRDMAKIPLRGWPAFKGHSDAAYIRSRISDDVWKNYFVFTFERNPYARALSQFYWNTRKGGTFEGQSIVEHFDNAESFRRSNWGCYAIDGKVVVDRVYHYETLSDDLADLEKSLKLPGPIVLPKTKTGFRPKAKKGAKSLPPEMLERVESACAREIEYFGYGPDDPKPSRLHTNRQ